MHIKHIGQQLNVAIIIGHVVVSSIIDLLAEASLGWNFISLLSAQQFIMFGVVIFLNQSRN